MKKLKPIVQYWWVAIQSKFANKEDWQSWADKIITNNDDDVECWIYDVSTASSEKEFNKAVSDRLYEEERIIGRLDMNMYDGMLGYYYWRYANEELTLREFLLNVEEYLEGCSCHDFPRKKFYSLLNQVEAKQFKDLTEDEKKVTVTIFESHLKKAQSQWNEIQSYNGFIK